MKKILIISGGFSKEKKLVLIQIWVKELKKNGFKVKISEPNEQLRKITKSFKPDVIFNALHGQFGEDGYIQSIFKYQHTLYSLRCNCIDSYG